MAEWGNFFAAGIATGLYGLLCLVCFWRYHSRVPKAHSDAEVLITFASQSGTAIKIAQKTAEILAEPARVLPLNQLDTHKLRDIRRAYFILSTYGEGEPPDSGARFAGHIDSVEDEGALAHLEYAVLALGDSQYAKFCAFGRFVDQHVSRLGARTLFDRVELDASTDDDPSPLNNWFSLASGKDSGYQVDAQSFAAEWHMAGLVSRRLLNPGSSGPGLYQLQFAPESDIPEWEAGAIVEILPRNTRSKCEAYLQGLATGADSDDPQLLNLLADRQLIPPPELADLSCPSNIIQNLPLLAKREYSIASIPAGGTVDLLLRERFDAQGERGIATEYLLGTLNTGEPTKLRIRDNPLFRTPDNTSPVIFIGAGSGLAGLWAHLLERQRRKARENWLIFGERDREHDKIFVEELHQLQTSGVLTHLERAFSRCPNDPLYVQDMLRRSPERVRDWVGRGATIMVCGSRVGMGEGVDQALKDILGNDGVATLLDAGRYRRDVY